MTGEAPSPRVVRFGPFRLDLRSRELSRPGRTTHLPEKPFLVLEALIESPGELLTRSELRRRLWPDGTYVDFDNNLNSAVASLRVALRDSARRPRYIETLPRLGYRFVAGVRPAEASVVEGPAPAIPAPAPSSAIPRAPRWRLAALSAFLAVTVVTGLALRAPMDPGAPLVRPTSPPARGEGLPADPEARRAWLRAQYLSRRSEPGDLERALESFSETARRAPAFAPAHAGRAEILSRLAFSPGRTMESDLKEARLAALRALDLDGAQPAAHRVLAVAALHLDWDPAAARRAIRAALDLDPEDDRSHLTAASLHAVAGRHDEAVASARRAVELDPSSNLVRADLGFFYLAAGRYEDSVRACREALDLQPGFRPALTYLVAASERLGRHREAARAARRILEQDGALDEEFSALAAASPREFLEAFRLRRLRRLESAYAEDRRTALWLALAHAEMDHRSEALRYLQEAFEARDGWLIFAGSFPQLQPLRGDPEFDRLLGRLGLPAAPEESRPAVTGGPPLSPGSQPASTGGSPTAAEPGAA